jgi:hypothetical protein
MGRKYSNKINKKTLLQGLGVFLFSAFITVMFFQNCSQVSVSDLTLADKQEQARILRIGAGEALVEVGASQYEKTQTEFQVGLNAVPNLKQFWIVDNSGTMVANNLNLANSFSAMFDQSNQDSLYKFDTTAYLFSTAQTIPSYKGTSNDRAVISDIQGRQNNYFMMSAITDNIFDSQLRSATQNSGLLPGDNVGYSVKKINSSNTDFEIKIAPVLSKNYVGGQLQLSSLINKPANTNTTAFETEFKNKLAILKSDRVPTSLSNGISYQQSAQVIDKESGLCAIARILDDPSAMYSASDLLAFTVVTDENENDLSGRNCLKRTAYQQQNVDLVNGRCSEFETPFSYSVTTQVPNPTYCNVGGQNGYQAQFEYNTYSTNISYRVLDKAGATTYSTPQTKVNYTTPKTKTQQYETLVTYYLKSAVAPTYKYRQRTTKVSYYTKTCTITRMDGIDVQNCTVDSGQKFAYPVGDHYTDANKCKAAALAANSAKAITAVGPGIGAQYLPVCDPPVFPDSYVATPCTASVDCQVVLNTAGYNQAVAQPAVWVTGNKESNCNAAALAINSAAIVAAEAPAINSAHFPTCGVAQYNDRTCSPVNDPTNCKTVDNGTNSGSVTVKGTYSGAAQCTTFVPTGSAFSSCAAATSASGSGSCPAGDIQYGCASTTTEDTFKMTSSQKISDIKSDSECRAWVNGRSDNKVRLGHPEDVVCNVNTPVVAKVNSTRLFSQVSDGGNTLPVGSCGSNSAVFYNALSANDKAKVAQEDCKIIGTTNGTTTQRSYGGISCTAQLASDCSALGFRSCSTTTTGGGSTASTSGSTLDGNVPMKASCNSQCSQLVGACDDDSAGLTVAQYLAKKYAGPGRVINCIQGTQKEKTPAAKTITAGVLSNSANFCPASLAGIPRYFIQEGATYRTEAYVDEFVAGTTVNGNDLNPAKDLVTYIKDKVEQDNLNVNFTVFIRKTGEAVGTGTGIDYIGKHYESLVSATGGQAFSVTASSYADALTSLSAVIKSKLIRSFKITGMKPYQVITDVTIVRTDGSQSLSIGSWTQSGDSITIAKEIPLAEGDRVIVKFQNDDGYVKAQLKKVFILDEMRPDQIIVSVEHIKSTGETVLLRTDQWLKADNTVTIASSVVINGGDQFRIKFKNNTDEE